MKKKALFIGIFAPPHKGHIEAIINLASLFDEVIIITFSKGKIITTMSFLKLFNSNDKRLAGRKGGSSQCFHIPLYGNIEEFNSLVSDTDDLRSLKFIRIEDALAEGLAYEQTEMVKTASKRLTH